MPVSLVSQLSDPAYCTDSVLRPPDRGILRRPISFRSSHCALNVNRSQESSFTGAYHNAIQILHDDRVALSCPDYSWQKACEVLRGQE